jgi:hypothetical protein
MKPNPNLIVIVLAGLIVGFVFWPTLYLYEKSSSDIIRINRVTGSAQILRDTGWKDLGPKPETVGRGLSDPWADAKAAQALPTSKYAPSSNQPDLFVSNPFQRKRIFLSSEDFSKIEGNASLTGYGYFKGNLYNGTSVVLGEIGFEITAKRGEVVFWKRKYQQTFTGFKPMTSKDLLVPVAGDESGLSTEWRVISATREIK